MNYRDYFIRLTLAVYRVSELFPKDVSLKSQLRDSASKILSHLLFIFADNPISLNFSEKRILKEKILSEIEIVKNYLTTAQKESWVKVENLLVLKREYDKIKKLILRKEKEEELGEFISSRQKKILELLRKKGGLQISEIQTCFPISKRTLRRDLEELIEKKLIMRKGKGKASFYFLARK